MIDSSSKHVKKTSCVAGVGPTFHRVVFDVYGSSPLVKHFLNSHHLAKDAGTSVLVQRTEITELPPLCAETYRDVVQSALSNSRRSLRSFRSTSAKREKEYRDIKRKNKLEEKRVAEYGERILSNVHEVRKWSTLLRTDKRRGEGKVEEVESSNKSHHSRFERKPAPSCLYFSAPSL